MSDPAISIIFPTARENSTPILFTCLVQQQFKDFEVIIVDEYYSNTEEKVQRWSEAFNLQDKVTHVQREFREDEGEYYWGVSKAYNQGLQLADGELIISLQDYHVIPESALSLSWDLYSTDDSVATSAQCYKLHEGDSINHYGELKHIDYIRFEMNYASIPTQALRDIGGWDEEFDKGFHYENQDIGWRLSQSDIDLYKDKRIPVIELKHHKPGSDVRDTYGERNRQYLKEKIR